MRPSNKFSFIRFILAAGFLFFLFSACRKEINQPVQQEEFSTAASDKTYGHLKQTKTFSSDVAQKWLELQVRMLRLPAGPNIYGRNGHRYFLYSGIALYESVVGGMPAYQSLSGQLKDMPAMPSGEPGKSYHWPASANAALAFLTRNFFTKAPAGQRAAIDSLMLT
jgi:hypothetical protein